MIEAQFELDRRELYEALYNMRGIPAVLKKDKYTLAVLGDVLVHWLGYRITFTCTDLEVARQQSLEATSKEGDSSEGKFAVSYKELLAFVKEAQTERVRFHFYGNELASQVKCVVTAIGFIEDGNEARTLLPTTNGSEFPEVGDNPETYHKMSTADWIEGIRFCRHAASKDDTRPILTGIYTEFVSTGSNLDVGTMAAADGFRLAVRRHKDTMAWNVAEGYIVPARAYNFLLRDIVGVDEVQVGFTDRARQMFVAVGNGVRFTAMLIEGNFPNYEQIIPGNNQTVSTLFSPAYMARSVRTVSPNKSTANIVYLIFDKMGDHDHGIGSFLVAFLDSDIERASKAQVPCYYHGNNNTEDFQIAVNAKYLLDTCATYGPLPIKKLWLHLYSPSRPIKWHAVNEERENIEYITVVMPMHISGTDRPSGGFLGKWGREGF